MAAHHTRCTGRNLLICMWIAIGGFLLFGVVVMVYLVETIQGTSNTAPNIDVDDENATWHKPVHHTNDNCHHMHEDTRPVAVTSSMSETTRDTVIVLIISLLSFGLFIIVLVLVIMASQRFNALCKNRGMKKCSIYLPSNSELRWKLQVFKFGTTTKTTPSVPQDKYITKATVPYPLSPDGSTKLYEAIPPPRGTSDKCMTRKAGINYKHGMPPPCTISVVQPTLSHILPAKLPQVDSEKSTCLPSPEDIKRDSPPHASYI